MRAPTASAVLFGLNGTLWFSGRPPDSSRLLALAARRVEPFLRRRDLLPRVDLLALVSGIRDAVDEALEYPAGSLRQPQGSFIVRGAFAVLDIELSPEEGAEVWSAMHAPAEALGRELYPDVAQVLSDLKERGLRLGVVENHPYSGDLLRRDLEAYAIGRFFDAVVSSADAGFLKPHAAPFQAALRALSVEPDVTVMVGDDTDADVQGGHDAGLAVIWKRNGRRDRPRAPEADYVIDDLSEIIRLPFLPERRRQPALVPTESLMPHEDGNANRY